MTDTVRIFDNPNHRHYGPVRRMWVVLTSLDILDMCESISWANSRTKEENEWDQIISHLMDQGQPAEAAMNNFLMMFYDGIKAATGMQSYVVADECGFTDKPEVLN